MAYNPKTDWEYNDVPTETDANRWEQGILDAHNMIDDLMISQIYNVRW